MNPMQLVFYWFLSQKFVLYISFVPLMALTVVVGLISLVRRA